MSDLPAPVVPAGPVRSPHSGWQRLHPLSPLVLAGRGFLAVVFFLVVTAVGRGDQTSELIRLGVIGVALVVGFVSWLVTRWRLADGVLQIERGVIRRSSSRYALTQIQAVDIVRPGLARVFGMAELRVRLAGGGRTTGRLAYLSAGEAEEVRARLLALAHGVAEDAPAPPEQPFYVVDPGRLIGSILLSGPAVILAAAVAVLVGLAVVAPATAAGALSASFTSLVAGAAAVWQRFNGEYRLTVAGAPDGLRVRAGLVETSAETIPRSRIQALRMIQPVTWRPFGWWRVEVDVAGKGVSGNQNRAAKRAARVLLPVGTHDEAVWLVERVMPGGPTERLVPPARARWKTPLRYRNLSYGLNDRYVLTTSGRLRRVTDWVPLAKVQSIRRVEGPLQRRLGLAGVHLDTAGRAVFAVARDRERAEADHLMALLPGACRRARAVEAGPGTGRLAGPPR